MDSARVGQMSERMDRRMDDDNMIMAAHITLKMWMSDVLLLSNMAVLSKQSLRQVDLNHSLPLLKLKQRSFVFSYIK